MRTRFLTLVLAASIAVAAAPAWSQNPQNPEPPKLVEPPKELPKPQRGDPAKNLDKLFAALKIAPDAESAKFIENRIWALWFHSPSDTAALLMTRVKTAIEAKNLDLAIQLLTSVIEIQPDFIEAWNRRATIYYMKKDYGRSLEDIREVLAREPRHFGALSGLGMILADLGEEKNALDAFRRALAVHPRLERIPEQVKRLEDKLEGRGI